MVDLWALYMVTIFKVDGGEVKLIVMGLAKIWAHNFFSKGIDQIGASIKFSQ